MLIMLLNLTFLKVNKDLSRNYNHLVTRSQRLRIFVMSQNKLSETFFKNFLLVIITISKEPVWRVKLPKLNNSNSLYSKKNACMKIGADLKIMELIMKVNVGYQKNQKKR